MPRLMKQLYLLFFISLLLGAGTGIYVAKEDLPIFWLFVPGIVMALISIAGVFSGVIRMEDPE